MWACGERGMHVCGKGDPCGGQGGCMYACMWWTGDACVTVPLLLAYCRPEYMHVVATGEATCFWRGKKRPQTRWKEKAGSIFSQCKGI